MKTKFKENKGISKMNIPFVRSKTSAAGITLIALVITIVLNCYRSGRKLEYAM